ncbi:FAD-binding domain-containing protein [Ramaria rubella]|nr:FAD-binding domain-containing protein [Ramaria rubella]
MLLYFSVLLSLGTFARVQGQNVSYTQACLDSIPNLLVINQSSPNYTNASAPFNLRISTDPFFVVSPTTVPQIQSIVSCAAQANFSVSAKSGGHSYAAYGLSGEIVIDMQNFKGLTLNKDETVRVETGNRLGEVATGIFAMGGRALPHGSCPYVGTGGHTLYGGFGYFSRLGGLLLDTVVSAEVVLANGTAVTASNTSHTDLFWALRGGGPSFGLVTAWTYATFAAPPTTVNYEIAFGNLTAAAAASAYTTFEAFCTEAPDALALAAVFTPGPPGQGEVGLSFEGDFYGSEAEFWEVMGGFIGELEGQAGLKGRVNVTAQALGWIQGLEALGGDNGTLDTSHDTFFTKSVVTTKPDSEAAIKSWIEYLATNGSESDTAWFAQVDLYGGAIARVPPSATAFAHRNAFLVYQLYASSLTFTPPYPVDGIPFVDGMQNALLLGHPAEGAYPNYIDPTLSEKEWRRLYFGNHTGRLERFKREVDPEDVFRFKEGF